MIPRGWPVLTATVLAAVTCSGSLAGAAGGTPAGQDWAQIVRGLRPALDRASANPCQRGDLRCFDVVLAEMKRRADVLAARCAHSVLFAQMYLRTTEELRAAARSRRFRDPALLSHVTAWFARFYFGARTEWQAGGRDLPAAWRIAFEAGEARRVTGLGDLLLGMNTHISHDLAYSVADAFPRTSRADYTAVSKLVERVSEKALGELASRFDPALAYAHIPLTVASGRRSLGVVISLWREEAWRDGQGVRQLPASEQPSALRRIDRKTERRALAIVAATSYLPLVSSSRIRDAYCASHKGR